MDRESESKYFLDLSRCEPNSSISSKFEKGKWTAVDYEIEAGSGRMLFCGPDTDALPIVLKLSTEGWHAIYVGTYPGASYQSDDLILFLKLTGDPAYSYATVENFRPNKDIVPPEMIPSEADISEAFWKFADLTGQDLVFHRPQAGADAESPTNICYVRIVPLSGAEAERAERDRSRRDVRRLIANHDSGQHTRWGYASRRDMQNEFQGLRDSDFRTILWGCSLGLGYFLSVAGGHGASLDSGVSRVPSYRE